MNQARSNASEVSGHMTLRSLADGDMVLEVGGHWLRNASIAPVAGMLQQIAEIKPRRLQVSAVELIDWDSRLPGYLFKIATYCSHEGVALDYSGLPEGAQSLLKLALSVPERSGVRRGSEDSSLLENIGSGILELVQGGRDLVCFIGELVLASAATMRGKARFRAADLFIFIQDAGPNGFPIVSLISLLVGLILAFVGALQLAMFGAQIYIADLVALGTVREMGPLMTAIIMSGRTGAAYAAQLGTMNVNSEIDALRTMGLAPMEFLVMPRMLALIAMMPLLTMYADFMGILGGALVSVSAFDLSLIQYYNEIVKAVDLTDFVVGFFKSLVFAVLIAIAGCRRGMACGRSASAVGDAATAAVVDSIVYLVVADSVLTLICNRLSI